MTPELFKTLEDVINELQYTFHTLHMLELRTGKLSNTPETFVGGSMRDRNNILRTLYEVFNPEILEYSDDDLPF